MPVVIVTAVEALTEQCQKKRLAFQFNILHGREVNKSIGSRKVIKYDPAHILDGSGFAVELELKNRAVVLLANIEDATCCVWHKRECLKPSFFVVVAWCARHDVLQVKDVRNRTAGT